MTNRKNNISILTAFVDLTMNMVLFVSVLFIISFMLIAEQKKVDVAKIDSKDSFLINLNWADNTNYDIDVYVKGPDDTIIYFRNKSAPWGDLERDDMGTKTDTVVYDGISYPYNFNREVVHLRNLVEGVYVVNIHHYSKSIKDDENNPQKLQVELVQLEPAYSILFKKELEELPYEQEITVFSFVYKRENKSIESIDTVSQDAFIVEQNKKENGGK